MVIVKDFALILWCFNNKSTVVTSQITLFSCIAQSFTIAIFMLYFGNNNFIIMATDAIPSIPA